MMANPVYITDIFRSWMGTVRAANPVPGYTVQDQAAHLVEILENLIQLDKAGKSHLKFPLVMLLCDVPEEIGGRDSSKGQFQFATLNIVIANTTKPNYRQPERLEKNFKPILYPIYSALLSAIKNSPFTSVYNMEDLPHKKWDRYYWGKSAIYGNTAHIANDYIDAIEIHNLRVKINNKFCLIS